jgi:hypothetical protein
MQLLQSIELEARAKASSVSDIDIDSYYIIPAT